MDLIRSPFKHAFDEFAERVTSECLICSPYITFGPVRTLANAVAEKKMSNEVRISILTDISFRTLVQGATDISALLYLIDNHRNVSITYLPRIHAKVYIADRSYAIIASANFTRGGETENFEYGVKVTDVPTVQRIQNDINGYKNLGANVTSTQLKEIQTQVEDVRKTIHLEQKRINQKLRLSVVSHNRCEYISPNLCENPSSRESR